MKQNYFAAHKQQGMTFLGMAVIIATVIMIAIVGMKMAPAYMEFFALKNVLSSMQKEGIHHKRDEEIKRSFETRADLQDIHSVKGEDLEIDKTGSETEVTVDYQVKRPIMGNVSVLIDFHASSKQ